MVWARAVEARVDGARVRRLHRVEQLDRRRDERLAQRAQLGRAAAAAARHGVEREQHARRDLLALEELAVAEAAAAVVREVLREEPLRVAQVAPRRRELREHVAVA